MPTLILNGVSGRFPEGWTILQACHARGVGVPALCHDDRLQPAGACRLCGVEVKGWDRLAAACSTPLTEGMEITTHSAAAENVRRTLLTLLARDYPARALHEQPDMPFHRLLRHYGVVPGGVDGGEGGPGISEGTADGTGDAEGAAAFRDETHPFLSADLSRCITCFRCVRICDEVQGKFVWRAWGRGAATRIRPGEAQTLLDSACVSCGACADTCPTGAIEDQTVRRHGAAETWTRTVCPYCGVGCEMNVGARDGQIIQITPAADAPVNRGHLCVKGRYAFGFATSQDRVRTPLIREHGLWRPASWEEAIGVVAGRFRNILDTTGPDSLGVLGSARGGNEESYLAQKFARVVVGTNNVDCCARVCHAPTAVGMKRTLGTGAATNSFDDIEKAACFLLCGCNPAENHPVVGARIQQAVARGAKLVVIDPRAIEPERATVHLAPRPGTNVPLLNALAHVILAERLADAAALRDRVENLPAFEAGMAEWTPERAGALCGVPPGLIRQAARLYATAKPAMCFHGLGVTEHSQGTEAVVCLVNLALLTGNLGKPGCGVNPLRGQNNVQGAAHMGCDPGSLTGGLALESGRAAFESAWHAPLPRAPGLNLMEMMDAAEAGRLQGLWAIGYDIALTNPDSEATRRALGKLGFVVVQDLFLNNLAREFGSVFLPACSSFEKEGTFMNSERRVQRVRPAIAPVGLAKPDWWILCEVAKAMGVERGFGFTSAREIWEEIRTVWPAGAGMSWERLERGGLQWPCPAEDHPGTAVLHTDEFPHGPKGTLTPVAFLPTPEAVTEEFPFLLATGRTLYQFNAGTMTDRTPARLLRPADTLDMHADDARRLGLDDGERVRVRSRHGEATLPLRLDSRVKPGELFATFHSPLAMLNNLTGPHRDRFASTPEYKVVAVRVEKS